MSGGFFVDLRFFSMRETLAKNIEMAVNPPPTLHTWPLEPPRSLTSTAARVPCRSALLATTTASGNPRRVVALRMVGHLPERQALGAEMSSDCEGGVNDLQRCLQRPAGFRVSVPPSKGALKPEAWR